MVSASREPRRRRERDDGGGGDRRDDAAGLMDGLSRRDVAVLGRGAKAEVTRGGGFRHRERVGGGARGSVPYGASRGVRRLASVA